MGSYNSNYNNNSNSTNNDNYTDNIYHTKCLNNEHIDENKVTEKIKVDQKDIEKKVDDLKEAIPFDFSPSHKWRALVYPSLDEGFLRNTIDSHTRSKPSGPMSEDQLIKQGPLANSFTNSTSFCLSMVTLNEDKVIFPHFFKRL
jgi:hypothetical protein